MSPILAKIGTECIVLSVSIQLRLRTLGTVPSSTVDNAIGGSQVWANIPEMGCETSMT
jgi:hypothetical protein